MKTLNTHIQLNKTSGKKTIARADELFSYIDSDFTDRDTPSGKTEAVELAVCEMTENGTFAKIFTNPEEVFLTQHQIIEFVENHKDKLRTDRYATFFLFKEKEKFFVANVYVHSDGLYVHVDPFSRGYVWSAGRRRRFVVPQLALTHLDSVTLGNFISELKGLIKKYEN